ncbi:MAG: QueT transporter family protein [Candidatus Bathyarchaeota archaeon]|nr:QueT transporter family protein [Candidatus Bathyarchaeota archaeon]
MKVNSTREIALAIIFASLYALAVIALAPISFNIFQVRIADSLLPLSIIFGWPSVLGITMGTIVANFFGGLGIIDVVGGAIANFIATLLAWKIGFKKTECSKVFAIVTEILVVTLVVGSYLSFLFNIPILVGLFGIMIGSIISIGFLGYLLLTLISRRYIVNALKSIGL